jgi:hypothetical protein
MMAKVKVMPYTKKYTNVQNYIAHEAFVAAFIEKHLGNQAVVEFRKVCQKNVKPIPEEASSEAKYEIAYGNWIWMGSYAFSFIRERLGEDGIKQFIRADVEVLKRENASPAMILLRLIRAISPGLAFTMVAKQTVYNLQWLCRFAQVPTME